MRAFPADSGSNPRTWLAVDPEHLDTDGDTEGVGGRGNHIGVGALRRGTAGRERKQPAEPGGLRSPGHRSELLI